MNRILLKKKHPAMVASERYQPRCAASVFSKDYLYHTVQFLSFITIFLSVAFVKFGISGIPLRAMTAILIIFVVMLCSPGVLILSVKHMKGLISVILVCALIGILSSVLNGMPYGDILKQITEIHVQAIVSVVVSGCILQICGVKVLFQSIAAVILGTTIIALLQFLHVPFAWEIRDSIQRIQPADLGEENVFLQLRLRAMGLSFSPVHLGTQLCLLFAAGYAYYSAKSRTYLIKYFNIYTFGLLIFLIVGSIICGNRSPLVGAAIFILVYLIYISPAMAIIILFFVAPFVVFIDDILLALADLGWRVAKTDDGSSAGRAVLRALGVLLFFDRPYGYGLSFNSVDHWQLYWDRLKNYANPLAITQHALHNYYLLVLNKYGIFFIGIAVFVSIKIRKYFILSVGFIPYGAHIFYHNDGPFQADFLIWFVIPIYLSASKILKEAGR